MKQQIKTLTIFLGVNLTIIATVFSASATPPALQPAVGPFAVALPALGEKAPLAACTEMEPSEVAWVILNEDGDIEEQVESYDSGTDLITPVFEYKCVPKKITITTVFYLGDEVVFSDKETLKSSKSKGLYGYPLGTEDGSAMNDGTWAVEFYDGKKVLTSGTVVIGEESRTTDDGQTQTDVSVSVEGTVTDKKTKKPVKGAVVLVLQPGITVDTFVKNGQKKKDVLTAGQSDSKGQFVLESPLNTDATYSIIVVAKGYKPVATDDFPIPADSDDPVQLNVTLTK